MKDNIKDQVPSIDACRRLEEAGITIKEYKRGMYCYDSIGRLLLVVDANERGMIRVCYVQMTVPGDCISWVRTKDCTYAPDIDELRKWFGNLMTAKARKRTGNEVVYFNVMNGGRRGKGSVGLMSFEGHLWDWYKKIPVEDSIPQAAADLLLWAINKGYIEGGEI